jgi:hypothetical protein
MLVVFSGFLHQLKYCWKSESGIKHHKTITPYSFLTNVKNVVIFVVRRSYIVCADSDTKATELGYIFTFHIGL